MNKYIILALIFLIFFKENFCSQNDLNETNSQPDAQALSEPDTEVSFLEDKKMKLIVNWADVKEELQRQKFVWDSFESYTQNHGCATDQKFISFPAGKFKKRPTWGLIALLNKKENIVSRQ